MSLTERIGVRGAGRRIALRVVWALLLSAAGFALWGQVDPAGQSLARGDWWLRRGDVQRAEAAYQRVLVQTGNAPGVLFLVGMRFLRERQWDAASRYLERVVAADPEHVARVLLGAAYEKMGRDADAHAAYREALRRRPNDPTAMNGLAYFYAQRGYRLDLAARILHRALELEPDEAAFVDSLGWVLYQQGNLAGALQQLSRAVRGDPSDAEVRYHYGVALARAGRRDSALVELGKAVMRDPTLEEARRALEWVRAGERPPVPLVPPGMRRPPEPAGGSDEPAPTQPRVPSSRLG